MAQRVEAVNLDPKAIKGPGIIEMQLAADKIIKHPGLKDTPLDIADGKRLKVASMQVMQLAEGKELVAPQQQQQQPAASVQERPAQPGAVVVRTHQEAQPVFAAAARAVAKELEASGQGLNGARLREVAKDVERNPVIVGANAENFRKAMDAAEKVPGLSGNKFMDELRSSSKVLEKSPPGQERNGPSAGRSGGGIER